MICPQSEAASALPPVTVAALASSHLEVVLTAPRLSSLDAMLAERPYRGADEEMDAAAAPGNSDDLAMGEASTGLYTFDDLLRNIQVLLGGCEGWSSWG
jgi:Sister chromatid cohesion protein Dcc1